jgi:hypothetical protein
MKIAFVFDERLICRDERHDYPDELFLEERNTNRKIFFVESYNYLLRWW